MAASRFRPPIKHTPALMWQWKPGYEKGIESEPVPVLRKSRKGICNMPAKARAALRRERKADPNGTGVHSWRRRQWTGQRG